MGHIYWSPHYVSHLLEPSQCLFLFCSHSQQMVISHFTREPEAMDYNHSQFFPEVLELLVSSVISSSRVNPVPCPFKAGFYAAGSKSSSPC